MRDIDQISEAIGSLKATVVALEKTIVANHASSSIQMNDVIKSTAIMDRDIRTAHNRIDNAVLRLDGIMEPELGELAIAYEEALSWKETKKKAKWLIGGGVLAGTSGGFSIGKIVSSIFGAAP